MAQRVVVELHIDETGAVRGIKDASQEAAQFTGELDNAGGSVNRLARVADFAFGQILASLLQTAVRNLRRVSTEMLTIMENVQDVDGAFKAMWTGNQSAADEFVRRFRQLTGFTTTEARKIVTELGGIARSWGLAGDEALVVAERSAELAFRWEQIAGQDFDRSLDLITRALTGNAGQLQRAGILTREQATEFRNMTDVNQRLNVVTQSLTARYGDLSEATDGITQRNRRLRGSLLEVRDNIARELTPQYVEVLDRMQDWINDNEKLIALLSDKFIRTLTATADMLGAIASGFRDVEAEGRKLSGFLTIFLRAWHWFERSINRVAQSMARLEIWLAEMQLKFSWLGFDVDKVNKRLGANRAVLNALQQDYANMVKRQADAIDALREEQEERDNNAEATHNNRVAIEQSLSEQIKLREEQLKAIQTQGELTGYTEELGKEYRRLRDEINELRAAQTLLNLTFERGREGIAVQTAAVDTGKGAMLDWSEVQKELAERQLDGVETSEDAERAMINLSTTAQNAIGDLAQSFGELLAGFDNVDDFGARIRGLAGNLLVDFGRTLVSLGTMQLAITAWNPFSMIAAGTAAIAVGTAMRQRAQSELGGGTGAGAQSGSGASPQRITSPAHTAAAHPQNFEASMERVMNRVKWKASTDIDMGKLRIGLEADYRKRNDTT